MDDESGESMEPMEEVPFKGLCESELERLVRGDGQQLTTKYQLSAKAVFNADELNCSARTTALQPINFVTLMRVTNNAWCNWVNLVQVSSVQFICCEHGLIDPRDRIVL